MQIYTTNTNSYKPTFSALKKIKYSGSFDPTYIVDARSVRDFLENESFQKLCQICDVKAEFYHGRCLDLFDFLTLYCTGVKPPQNKQQDKAEEKTTFLKKLKSFFTNKHSSEPVSEHIVKEGDNFIITFVSDWRKFNGELARTTWYRIQEKILKAKKMQDEKINSQQELDNIKKAHSQWL